MGTPNISNPSITNPSVATAPDTLVPVQYDMATGQIVIDGANPPGSIVVVTPSGTEPNGVTAAQLAGMKAQNSVAFPYVGLKKFGGIPIVTFNNGLADINVGQSSIGSGGSYTPRPGQGLTAATPMEVVPGPSGAVTYLTIDLSSTQTSNLKQFFYENANAVIAVLLKVPPNRPYSNFDLFATTQALNFAANGYTNATISLTGLSRPGWYLLSATESNYGFADTTNTVQYGMVPRDGTAVNSMLDNNTNACDRIRLRFNSPGNNTNGTAAFLIDSVWLLPHAPGIAMLHFDDGYITQYTEGFEYAARRGLVGTVGIVSSLLDTVGYMTTSQALEMYAAGWDLVNHTATHIDVNAKSLNNVAASQTPSNGPMILATTTLDKPRCLTLTCSADETGRPLTVIGYGEGGAPQTVVMYGTNASITVSEEVWTGFISISGAAAWTGAVTMGTTYSQDEVLAEYTTCRNKLLSMGVTRGLDCTIYPNGSSNTLTDRVMATLGITVARTLNSPAGYAYPFAPGFQALQMPGYGGGGATGMNQRFSSSAARFNTGNGTIGSTNFTAGATPQVELSVVMTAATTFNVTDKQTGAFISTGSTGVAYLTPPRSSPLTGQNYTVGFTVTAGGTAFVAGDEFSVFVTSLTTTYEKETARRMACGCCYFHKLARNGAQDSLTTFVPDFRATVDEMAKDKAAGRIQVPTMSQFSAMLKAN